MVAGPGAGTTGVHLAPFPEVRKTDLRHLLTAMRNCGFLYEPWHVRPRTCLFTPSTFVLQKATVQKEEIEKREAVREDMRLPGIS